MPGIKDLRERLVVVTGAASGIGFASAALFANKGARVILADINQEGVHRAADEIHRNGGTAHAYHLDVANEADVNAFARDVTGAHGRVAVLFNNAGVGVSASIADTPLDDWKWLVGINYWGVVYGIKAFLPHMGGKEAGHILNTASMAGLVAAPTLGAYCSTKHALVGLGQTLRIELRARNIGVTTICPGVINTNIPHASRYVMADEDRAQVIRLFETRAWPPERVAKAVLKAMRWNRAIVPVGPEAWFAWYLNRLSPRLMEALAVMIDRRLGTRRSD
jgi:NAD(P)-dependent dehydrogenase (short-subunit alcohol dehydrogenase family)